ncbi:MAG: mechanosensitive ion channel [Bdellovibrionaceae bacterium]|nr:mechanosensitive ion channel [Pseudobdellovibrionaceae bacterium]
MKSFNSIWEDNLRNPFENIWATFVEYTPNLLGTVLLLLVGYLVSKLFAGFFIRILKTIGIDKISEKINLHKSLENIGIKLKISELFGAVFFWLVMLVFIISAVETLNLGKISDTIDVFLRYLPNIIGAGLILVLGLMVAQFFKNVIAGMSQVSPLYSKILSLVVYFVIVVLVSVLSIGQLQLETELINRIIEIVLISAGVVLALSFGLGTKDLSKSILSGLALREQIEKNTYLEYDNINGKLEKVGLINTILRTEDGKLVHIPNAMLITSIFKSKA